MPTFVADEIVTATKLNAATARDWTDWVPTLTNLTLGNGTQVARFAQVGKIIVCHYTWTLGSTSAVGSIGTISVPVTAAAGYTATFNSVGNATFIDSGTEANNTEGKVRLESTTTFRPIYFIASTTNVTTGGVAATTPFTWATGDILHFTAVYEGA